MGYIGIALIMVVVFLIFYYIGFRIPARVQSPLLERLGELESTPTEEEELPPLLKNYFKECFGEQLPLPGTAVAWGRGKIVIRRFGALGPLWAPLRWAVYLVPGEQYVLRTTITWFTVKMLQGGDEFRERHGRFIMGSQSLENENINRSEWVLMWAYTMIAAPMALLGEENIEWKTLDEHAVEATIHFPDAQQTPWTFVLRFDPETGNLYKIETERTASRSGTNYPYQVWLSDTEKYQVGRLPSRIRLAWDGEDHINLDVIGVRYNLNINHILAHGASESAAYTPPAEDEGEADPSG